MLYRAMDMLGIINDPTRALMAEKIDGAFWRVIYVDGECARIVERAAEEVGLSLREVAEVFKVRYFSTYARNQYARDRRNDYKEFVEGLTSRTLKQKLLIPIAEKGLNQLVNTYKTLGKGGLRATNLLKQIYRKKKSPKYQLEDT